MGVLFIFTIRQLFEDLEREASLSLSRVIIIQVKVTILRLFKPSYLPQYFEHANFCVSMSLVWYFRDWSYAGLSSTPESRVVFFEIELFDIFSRASCCFSLLKHAAACCHYLLLLYTSRCFKYLSSLVLCRCRLFYLLPAFASCDMFSASCRCLLPPLVIARFLRLLLLSAHYIV